jgi:hypothetical protein
MLFCFVQNASIGFGRNINKNSCQLISAKPAAFRSCLKIYLIKSFKHLVDRAKTKLTDKTFNVYISAPPLKKNIKLDSF